MNANTCTTLLDPPSLGTRTLLSGRLPTPSQNELKDAVLRMREKGLKATGCNAAIRAINAYLKWSGSRLKVPQLKEPHMVLPTFTAQQVRLLVTWKPRGFYSGGFVCLCSSSWTRGAASRRP